MASTVRMASDYDKGASVQYMLQGNATFTQRLRATVAATPAFLGLWLGNNQNPFNMRLQVAVNGQQAFDQTYSGLHQRYSDWAVPFDLSGFSAQVNAGDWITFSITPNQDIGFSPVLVDSPDWPRGQLPGYGSVAARFFLDGIPPAPPPSLHQVAPLHYPGCSGNAHYSHPALLMFGLQDGGLPVILRYAASAWEAALIGAAANPDPLNSLAPVLAADASVHLFGARQADGMPVVAAWMDNSGNWRAGGPAPADRPLSNFIPIIDGDRCTRVAALDAYGRPHVTAYNYWDQYWMSFFPLDTPAPMTALAAAAAGETVYLLGIGKNDSQAYTACVLQAEEWQPGSIFAAAGPPLAAIATATDGPGNTWLLGLGKDGKLHIIAHLDPHGAWQPGATFSATSGGNLSAIAAETDDHGNIHVLGLDAASHLTVGVCRLDAQTQQWGAPLPLPPQTQAAASLCLVPGDTADAVAVATDAATGQPFIACSLAADGAWHAGPAE